MATGTGVGENLTWLPLARSPDGSLDNATLSRSLREGGTIVSRGPFLDVRVGDDWAPGQTYEGAVSLDVDVRSASWVVVDTVDLLENGVVVESRPWEGTPLRFSLAPDADAVYVVMAHGAERMAPVYPGQTPWAMCAAIKVDTAGDGWDPPLPDLTLGD